jgi:hypothetical protein
MKGTGGAIIEAVSRNLLGRTGDSYKEQQSR